MTRDGSDELLDALLQASLDGMACLVPVRDENGEITDFRVTRGNLLMAEMIGVSRDELESSVLSQMSDADRFVVHLQRFSAALETGQASEFHDEVVFRDNQEVFRHHVIPIEGMILLQTRRVTNSWQAQKDLRDSREYLRSIMTNAPIIMYELDRKGQFKLSTGRSLNQIGLAQDEAVGSSILDFFEVGSPEVDAFERALEGETVSTQTQLGDGYFASRYGPRYGDNGEIVGVLGVSYDISDQKKAEEKLQRALRLEAVGQLTGGIAHDFNNLLAIVLGNLDLIERLNLLDQDAQGYLQNAISATERGAILTKRLLAFSREQLLEPCTTDANELVAGMLGLLSRLLPESIEVKFVPAQDLWNIYIDPPQLEHAILNLCVNARDAMPEGGQLTLTTRNLSVDAERAGSLDIAPGEYVELVVEDSGEGLSDELRKNIFEPFFTTKDVGEGSGLGLSMVYGFLEQSGGAIDVASAPGSGARFSMVLPTCLMEDTTISAEPQQESIDERGNGERILIVEDDADVRQFVSHALSALNYDVAEARNANMAMAWLENGHEVDLLFTDVVLTGQTNGIQLAQEAMRLRPGLRVLLTSGHVGDVDKDALRGMELIKKPYRTAELYTRVRAMLQSPGASRD